MTRIEIRLMGLIVAGAMLAGCGAFGGMSSNDKDRSRMDMQSAADRADVILDATFKAINPSVAWAHGVTTTGSCELSRRRVVMTDISERRRGAFLGVVERYWRRAGYEITSVNNDKKFPAIFGRSIDDFQLALTIGYKGQAFFEVATPCVKESPVAESTTQANGPNYQGGPIPRPNVHDDFWSSGDALPSSSPSAL